MVLLSVDMNLCNAILTWFPKRKRERGETSARAEGEYEGARSVLKRALEDGFPGDAALAVALRTSGGNNVNEVLDRLSTDDVDRIVRRISVGSEILPQLVRQTQYASNEPVRDLLARILRGELDNPNQTPRSVTALIEKLGQHDLHTFLKLRRVLWLDLTSRNRVQLYCMYDSNDYPGLMSESELTRLDELGLVGFAPVSYHIRFHGDIAQKIVSFGNKQRRIVSTKPDAILQSGHWNFTSDGRFVINLFMDREVQPLEGHFEFNVAAWRNQGFKVEDIGETAFVT